LVVLFGIVYFFFIALGQLRIAAALLDGTLLGLAQIQLFD
jgi:hypothetical protein